MCQNNIGLYKISAKIAFGLSKVGAKIILGFVIFCKNIVV